uniref:Uncharacterized protein n=1 Tax=Anguilla anguilla TaxID=7936 RepID=A0A0E9SSH5_ANGAN
MVLFLISPKRKPSHFITGFEISADFKLDHHATLSLWANPRRQPLKAKLKGYNPLSGCTHSSSSLM